MGKINRLKHLLGRFNGETKCELRALPYSFGGTVCEMLLKIDLNHTNSLAVANVPYYLEEIALKEFCSSALGTEVAEVHLTASTALHGNLKRGYRSGRLVFPTIHAQRRAFNAISNDSICPLKLESLNVKLPAWHKPTIRRFGKRKCTPNEGIKDMDVSDEMKSTKPVDANQPDEDGWITVTRKHKFSFRGTINRAAWNKESVETKTGRHSSGIWEEPMKKRRR